ncbi:YbaK/EbsC family protein [Leifsonia aquatica]|uniref:YbaK/EbsC family protein n=1 Tax=Leifsonia aquatica TaxID=144185 RepID=UPI0028AC79DD|nr:YbaK/EbsC family protein [Leifsonia aquatica]
MTEKPRLPERSRIVQQHLTDAGLDARVRELPDSTRTAAEAADALGCEIGAIASSLLFLADGAPLLVMTSGRHRVDTMVLASEIGATTIAMASAKDVRAITGQAIGGVAPIGHPEPVRTVVDHVLAEYDTIWAAAGTPHTVVPLSYQQLTALTGGASVSVATD